MITITFIAELSMAFLSGCLFSMLLMWFIFKLSAKYVLLNKDFEEAAVLPPTTQGQNEITGNVGDCGGYSASPVA